MSPSLLFAAILCAFLSCLPARAQSLLAAAHRRNIASGPVLIVSTQAAGTVSGVTTSGVTTTGANFIVANVAFYSAAPGTFTDSKGNTYTALTTSTGGPNFGVTRLYYCENPIVGTGHTFTSSHGFCSVQVMAFSGVATSSFDVQNAGFGTGTTLQPGSVTPSQAHTLVITGIDHSSTTAAINGGFSTPVNTPDVAANAYGGAMSYLVLSAATATNPTWTVPVSKDLSAAIAVFKY